MGVDIHTQIFHKTNSGYEELKLYKMINGEMKPCDDYVPYNDRNYNLFEVIRENLPARGMWNDMPQESREHHYYEGRLATYGHTWFDMCELNLLIETSKAEIVDWTLVEDDMEEKDYPRYNVLRPWVENICFVLDCYGIWFPNPGEVIICVAFDR